MPIVTRVTRGQKPNAEPRKYIYVDGNYEFSVKERHFDDLGIQVGKEIDVKATKEKAEFLYKNTYSDAWVQEQWRIDQVMPVIQAIDERLLIKKVGYGTDNPTLIRSHQNENERSGPDLDIGMKGSTCRIMRIEVSGAQRMRGSDYWVRADKIEYMRRNPNQNIWVALHYAEPSAQIIFVKPDITKDYPVLLLKPRDITERFISFAKGDPEVKTFSEIRNVLCAGIQYISNLN